MTHVTAATANDTMHKNATGKSASRTLSGGNTAQTSALTERYQRIGIAAVLAATRYHGGAKNPATAAAPANQDESGENAAA
jgi:hypothetical protein